MNYIEKYNEWINFEKLDSYLKDELLRIKNDYTNRTCIVEYI